MGHFDRAGRNLLGIIKKSGIEAAVHQGVDLSEIAASHVMQFFERLVINTDQALIPGTIQFKFDVVSNFPGSQTMYLLTDNDPAFELPESVRIEFFHQFLLAYQQDLN